MTARDTFAARFGEDQAVAVERAAKQHFDASLHANDDLGSDEFRYWFLLAIGRECVSKYLVDHGITADVDEMKDWGRGEGALREHDGDIPDYLAAMMGAYNDWIMVDPELSPDAARVVPQ